MRTVLFIFVLPVLNLIHLCAHCEEVELPADHRAVVVRPDRDASEYNQLTPQLTPAALKVFEKRAEQDDPVALDIAFYAHLSGFGCDANLDDARRWLDLAWHAGTPLGALYRGRELLGLELFSDERNDVYGASLIHAALDKFADDAKTGNAAAVYFTGVAHESMGENSAAFHCFARAADREFLPARFKLALCYLNGSGVRSDVKLAEELLQRCAAQHLIQAQDQLGALYFDGTTLDRNDALSFQWSRQAASHGCATAQHRVGLMFALGRGPGLHPVIDEGNAADWLERAAAQGFAPSQVKLADLCASRDGLPDDEEAASDWYLRAAQQHNAEAAMRLSARFSEGRGLKLNTEESLYWMCRAAEWGSTECQLKLAQTYAASHHDSEAQKWFAKANALSTPPAPTQVAATKSDEHELSLEPELAAGTRAIEVSAHTHN